jgi:hypothetical protein
VLLAAAVAVVALGACSWGRPSFSDRLAQAAADGRPTRLADITDFEWDEVYVFFGMTFGSGVNEITGVHVMDDKGWSQEESNFWVFLLKRQPVHTIQTAQYTLDMDFTRSHGHWTHDVWLLPRPDGPGDVILSEDAPGSPETGP